MRSALRFTIRDLLWLALLVAVFTGWQVYRYRTYMQQLRDREEWHAPYQIQLKQAEEKLGDLEARYAELLRKNVERHK